MTYTLVRSRRKTLALHITRDAALEVRAPLRMSEAEIHRFVASRQGWIDQNISLIAARAQSRAAFAPRYGGTALMRGAECPIAEACGGEVSFRDGQFRMPGGLDSGQIKAAMVQAYKAAAKAWLPARTAHFAAQMGVAPAGIKIGSAKTRWGSCSGTGSINFSWRLIMADDDVIDYVVVHELAHLRQHNHSPGFWAVVRAVLPDYKHRQQRLAALGRRLAGEDWG